MPKRSPLQAGPNRLLRHSRVEMLKNILMGMKYEIKKSIFDEVTKAADFVVDTALWEYIDLHQKDNNKNSWAGAVKSSVGSASAQPPSPLPPKRSTLHAPHNPLPYSPQARHGVKSMSAKNQNSPIHRSARMILPSSSTRSRGTRAQSTRALPLSSSSSGASMGGRAPSDSSVLELNNGLSDDQALALALENSASAPTSTLNHHPAPKENRSPQSKPAKRQSNQVKSKRSLFRELFLDVVYY